MRREKLIFVTNGMARCGKDTFYEFLNEIVPVYKFSSITPIVEISKLVGYDGVTKTEKERKLWSEMKKLFTEYSNYPFKVCCEEIEKFYNNDAYEVMLIDIREGEEIDKLKKEYNIKTIFIENDKVKLISSNESDKNVFNYRYDYTVCNNGTLEEYKDNVEMFANDIILSSRLKETEEEMDSLSL